MICYSNTATRISSTLGGRNAGSVVHMGCHIVSPSLLSPLPATLTDRSLFAPLHLLQGVFVSEDGIILDGPNFSIAIITQDHEFIFSAPEGRRPGMTAQTLAQIAPEVRGR
jgi:hypothetical protein